MNLFSTYHGGGKGKGTAYSNNGISIYGNVYSTALVYNAAMTGPQTVRVSSASILTSTLIGFTNTNGSISPLNNGVYFVTWSGGLYANGVSVTLTGGIIKNNSGALENVGKNALTVGVSSTLIPFSGNGIFQLDSTDEISFGIHLLSGTVTVRLNTISLSIMKVV